MDSLCLSRLVATMQIFFLLEATEQDDARSPGKPCDYRRSHGWSRGRFSTGSRPGAPDCGVPRMLQKIDAHLEAAGGIADLARRHVSRRDHASAVLLR